MSSSGGDGGDITPTPADPNPNVAPPSAAVENQLTEEDLFRMKSMSGSGDASIVPSENADQSIISLADSTSNFGEHVGDEFDEVETVDTDADPSNGSPEGFDSQQRIFNGFMFNRKRPDKIELPKDTVTVLKFPRNVNIPPGPHGEDQAEWRRAFEDATVYLVGTAHFSKESQEDVLATIKATQPDMVMVELCPSRISILSMDEATLLKEAGELNMQKMIQTIKQSGAVQGILHVLLLSMSAHITRELSMAPGGEFRAAHRGVMQTQLCRLVLGDRPIQITFQRVLASLSFWQKLKFFWHVICSHNTSVTPEEIEKCKQRDLLEQLLQEMAGDFPKLTEILVSERDAYMAHALHVMLTTNSAEKRVAWMRTDAPWQPLRIVAVVGIGHTPGIVSRWDNPVDISPLLEVPPPSATGTVIRWGFRVAFWGVVCYGLYRGGARVARRFVH